MLQIRSAVLVVLTFVWPALAWSQGQITDQVNLTDYAPQSPTLQGNPASAPPSDSPAAQRGQNPTPQDNKDDSEGQQTKRMFYVVPNFAAVSAHTQLPPLSNREKFVLAAHDSLVDYSSFTWTAILAGQALALNSDPELGHGAVGYGRYYWRTFVDGVSGTFFTEETH